MKNIQSVKHKIQLILKHLFKLLLIDLLLNRQLSVKRNTVTTKRENLNRSLQWEVQADTVVRIALSTQTQIQNSLIPHDQAQRLPLLLNNPLLLKKTREGREDLKTLMKHPNQQGRDLQIFTLWGRLHHLGGKKGPKVLREEMAHKPVSKLKILIQNLNLRELVQHLWTLLSILPGGAKLMRMLKPRT